MRERSGTESDDESAVPAVRHQSALLQQVVENLALAPGQVIVDATLGSAGHFCAIAPLVAPGGIAIGIDRDVEAISRSERYVSELALTDVQTQLVHAPFSELRRVVARFGIEQVDRVLFDLGLSSEQLDPGRGFSFISDGPLDMRQDRSQPLTAAEVVNTYSPEELLRVLQQYGQERNAALIVKAIVNRRAKRAVRRTLELAEIICNTYPGQRGRIHPATRSFQALRVEVGGEMDQLRCVLPQVAEILAMKGRLAIITYQSVEDRVIKDTLRSFGRHVEPRSWWLVRRGPVVRPTREELERNPRVRSAKLRVYEKLVRG